MYPHLPRNLKIRPKNGTILYEFQGLQILISSEIPKILWVGPYFLASVQSQQGNSAITVPNAKTEKVESLHWNGCVQRARCGEKCPCRYLYQFYCNGDWVTERSMSQTRQASIITAASCYPLSIVTIRYCLYPPITRLSLPFVTSDNRRQLDIHGKWIRCFLGWHAWSQH